MLVISRKPGEKVRIGKDIWVTVISQRGNKVRLGIEAPPDVEVLRQELIGRDGAAIPTVWGRVRADDGRDGEGVR